MGAETKRRSEQPIPTLDEYRRPYQIGEVPTHTFVTIGEKLQSAIHRKEPKPVIRIHGIPNGGTTHGLKYLEEVASADSRNLPVYVDCSKTPTIEGLIKAVAKGLKDRGAAITEDITRILERAPAKRGSAGKDSIEALVRVINDLTELGMLPVILLDNVDRLPFNEQEIGINTLIGSTYKDVSKISQTELGKDKPIRDKSPIFVLASNGAPEKRARSYDQEIRKRTYVYEVEAMTAEEVRGQFERNKIPVSADLVRFAAGNPLLAQTIIDLHNASPGKPFDIQRYLPVVAAFNADVIEHVPPYLRDSFRVLACLRTYGTNNVELQEMLVKEGIPPETAKYYFMNQSSDLITKTPYISMTPKSEEQLGWQVHSSVRRTLDVEAELKRDYTTAARHGAAQQMLLTLSESDPRAKGYADAVYHTMQQCLEFGDPTNILTGLITQVVNQAQSHLTPDEFEKFKTLIHTDEDLQLGLPEGVIDN